jgi:hypothetical protein
VVASEGNGVAQIAHTATCVVMKAQASGQPPPIIRETANSTQAKNNRIRTTADTRRHVRTGFG